MNERAARVASRTALEVKGYRFSPPRYTSPPPPPTSHSSTFPPLPPARRRRPAPRDDGVPLIVAFQARSEARAILVAAGEQDLADAVDALQAAAVVDGLVDCLGQDEVQAILAEAFDPPSREPPSIGCIGGVASKHEMQRLQDAMIRCRVEDGAPEVTISALIVAFRAGGAAELKEAQNQQRLGRLSRAQLAELRRRIEGIAK